MALIRTHFKTLLSFSHPLRPRSEARKRESKFSVSFKKGITLTELLVGMAIAGGISLGVVNIYIAHYRIFTNQSALIKAETQNQLAIQEITKHAKEALSFSRYSQWSGFGENFVLGYRLLPLDQNGNPYDTSENDHIYFTIDPAKNNLVAWGETDAPSSTRQYTNIHPPDTDTTNPANNDYSGAKIIATGVTNFQITYETSAGGYWDADYADVNITTQSKNTFGKIFTSNQNVRIYLRRS